MAGLTLSLDGATIALKIRDHTYILVAPRGELTLPPPRLGTDSTPPKLPEHVKFQYKESPEQPGIDVGTPEEILEEIKTLLGPVLGSGQSGTLLEQWAQKKVELENVPVLGGAIKTVERTNVRITEIAIELTKPANGDTFTGKFRLGLMFTPNPSARPTLFNVQVAGFGAVVGIGLSGTTAQLGSFWPGNV